MQDENDMQRAMCTQGACEGSSLVIPISKQHLNSGKIEACCWTSRCFYFLFSGRRYHVRCCRRPSHEVPYHSRS